MGLADDIRTEYARRRVKTCQFAVFFASLTPADRKGLREVFTDRTISSATIFGVLRDKGKYPGGLTAIKEHRRSPCPECQLDPKGLYGQG